jgi:hypothetical protein
MSADSQRVPGAPNEHNEQAAMIVLLWTALSRSRWMQWVRRTQVHTFSASTI